MVNSRYKHVDCITILVRVIGGMVYFFMAIPVFVILLSAFSPTAYPQFPPTEFSFHWFSVVLTSKEWLNAFKISFIVFCITTPLATILGTLAAYGIARAEFYGREAIRTFILSPLMIPQIVLGIAVLYVFTAWGWIGSIGTLVIGHTLVALPYVIRTVGVNVSALDPALEQASMNLGANRMETFYRITIPLLRPGIIGGSVFAAVTSFGEVSISLFLVDAHTTTIPVRIFNYIEQTFDPSVNAVAALFILFAVIALIIIEQKVGLMKVS